MLYKSIILQMLEQHPQIRDQLKKDRQMLPMMEHYALDLKTRHETWKERLLQAMPQSDPNQIASEALELALRELEDRLLPASHSDDKEPLSLDAAMAFIRRRSPRE